jgi:hypothetical protein
MSERVNNTPLPELEPCPFCGGEGIYWWMPGHVVRCINEMCPVSPQTSIYDAKAEATAAWNHRTQASGGANADLDAAAEEYAYNPDMPRSRSGLRGETFVDPEEAFKAGARWQATQGGANDALIEALEQSSEALNACRGAVARGMRQAIEHQLEANRAALTLARDKQHTSSGGGNG